MVRALHEKKSPRGNRQTELSIAMQSSESNRKAKVSYEKNIGPKYVRPGAC
jgi:hypothetical protein